MTGLEIHSTSIQHLVVKLASGAYIPASASDGHDGDRLVDFFFDERYSLDVTEDRGPADGMDMLMNMSTI